jgi:hypothetical protein
MIKNAILSTLDTFIHQRPGFDPNDYASVKDYRADYRVTLRDLHDAERMVTAVSWRDSLSATDLLSAFKRAFSGRLSCTVEPPAEYEVTQCLNDNAEPENWITLRNGFQIGGYVDPKDGAGDAEFTTETAAIEYACRDSGEPPRVTLDYCTGQYTPMEYRAAACAVLAAALWAHWRSDLEPGQGHKIRERARNELGRGIQQRWFD